MRNYPRTTAEIAQAIKGLLDGAESNATEIATFGLYPEELVKELERYHQANALQEKLKADLHQATKDYRAARQSALKTFGKWVSILEGHYGKRKNKLEEFGIPPRMRRSRSRATDQTPEAAPAGTS